MIRRKEVELLKYRKVGLKMCVISIIMIALCIPNQIQVANAAEREADVIVKDQYGVKWDKNTKLEVFPVKAGSSIAWISSGDENTYKFTIYNRANFKIRYYFTVLEAMPHQRTVSGVVLLKR